MDDFDEVYLTALRNIHSFAKDYECCPYCGSLRIGGHYCRNCKMRYTEPADAIFFAQALENIIRNIERKGDE